MRDRVTLNVTHATAVARKILWRCLLPRGSKKGICKGGLGKTLQRKSRHQTNRETILIHLKQKLFLLGRLNCIYMRIPIPNLHFNSQKLEELDYCPYIENKKTQSPWATSFIFRCFRKASQFSYSQG